MKIGPDRAEQIKWYDALDALPDAGEVDKGLQLAHNCRHPDALWLASLFPPGVPVSRAQMREVMLEHGEDARAVYLTWKLGDGPARETLRRAAEMGYAPAQAQLAITMSDKESRQWIERAKEQGDRTGLFLAGKNMRITLGNEVEKAQAAEVFRQAAELGHAGAQFQYAHMAFDERDWERYYWWGRGARRGGSGIALCSAGIHLLPLFEKGELNRVLHTIAPVVRRNFSVAHRTAYGEALSASKVESLQRVLALHDAMLLPVKLAVACWGIVGIRLGAARDIRVMISMMVWQDVWRWGEKDAAAKCKEGSSG
jgi:hypothetical protein